MPTVPSYERSNTQLETSGFRKQAVAPEGAFGGNVGQALSAAGGEMYKAAVEQQAKMNQIAVANAMSETQKQLIPIQNEILSRQGENALGSPGDNVTPAKLSSSQDFTKQSDIIYNTTLRSFTNDTQRQNYQMWYNSNYPGMYQQVLAHETKQLNVAHNAANESQLNTNSEAFISNVLTGNYQQANKSLNDGLSLSNSMGTINGIPKATQDENSKKYIYGSIGKAVDIMIANSRPEDAKKLIDYYGDKLPESQKDIYMAKINPALEQNQTFNFVEGLKSNSAMLNPDGTLNQTAMLEAAKQKYLTATRKVVHSGTPGTSTISWSQMKDLVAGNESGGNYEAHNNDSGAHGKYQFMPGTWEGVMGDAPMTPDNQEKAFDTKYKPIFDKYGSAGVLVAVYAGDANAERYMNGQSLLGEGGEYSADAPQGNYPSVRQYVINALGNDGLTGGTPSTTEEVSAPDMVGYKLALSQINQAVAESNAKHKQDVSNSMYFFDQRIANEKPTTVAQIEAIAQEYGMQGPDLINAVAKGKQWAGLLKVEENEQTAQVFEDALGKIYRGEITTQGELDTQYGGSLPYGKLIMLGNSLKKETKWATPENMMAFNGVIRDKKIKSGEEKSRIYEKINQSVADSMSKGIPVTSEDIRTWTEEQTQKIILGRKWYGGSVKIDLGNVPSGWNVASEGVFTPEGVQVTNYKDGKFYATVNGVEIEVQP